MTVRGLALVFILLLAGKTISCQPLRVSSLSGVLDDAAKAGFTGVVVVTQHGKPVLTRAIGQANRESGTPLRPETVFRLASLTKQVTALLIMQQVKTGTMRLNERADDILPALPATTGRVTVEQLLQHISGLPNPSEGPEGTIPAFYKKAEAGKDYQQQTASGFCSGKPVRDPDVQFEYNNCDYIVLGALLEAVTHTSYAELVTREIIKPLHLKSWGVFTGAGSRPVVAKAYIEDGHADEAQNPATYGAAGALYGNALDVAAWDTALLTHRLLPTAETERMFRADPNLGGEALGSWSYDLPGTSPAVHLVERQGDIGATRLLNLLLPQFDASIVILANTGRADLFNTYSKQGLGYAFVKAATGQ